MEPVNCVESFTCTMLSVRLLMELVFVFFRTYFDNIVAIDSLLEHIMVGVFGFDCDFPSTLMFLVFTLGVAFCVYSMNMLC